MKSTILSGIKKIKRKCGSYLDARNLEVDEASLTQRLKDLFGPQISLKDITGRGQNATYLVQGPKGENLSIVKVVNKRREKRLKAIQERHRRMVYLQPKERFQREMDILSSLSAHNLGPKPIMATDKFFLREYVNGEPLSSYFNEPDSVLAEYLINALKTLGRLHQQGYVHGDPNPDNIIVTAKGMQLLDFDKCLNENVLSLRQRQAYDYLRFLTTSCSLRKDKKEVFYSLILDYFKQRLLEGILEEFPYLLGLMEVDKEIGDFLCNELK
ncbi:MAG: hypothetical protein JW869_03030 [Candidatus Omnitrophica bacterium]|nr:hypothetical protein [Candidatus Omnitrophota bacterium]